VSDTQLTKTSGRTVLFNQTRSYDAAGKVAGVQTTLPAEADNQAFCYDEENRLTWASSATGTPPCSGSNTAGTLPSTQYTNNYAYATLDRLTSGPQASNTYTYGDIHHLDGVTAIASGYTAAYDAAGNLTCRAPTYTTTCSGTQTGAQLSYDNEGRLSAWQNAPSSPSSYTTDLYDGEGQRVEQQVTTSGATTSTVYVGNLEEVATTGASTTTTAYYYAVGKRIAEAVSGTFSYLASDGLGSATLALDASGNVQAGVLYDPCGNGRYSSGTMPGTYGFTGQHADAATGLDYYHARYYDPEAGQFTGADAEQDGLNRYTYVHGNPETATDPSGHIAIMGDDGGGCTVNCDVPFKGGWSWSVSP
jgi:RHS repeat-associated protein